MKTDEKTTVLAGTEPSAFALTVSDLDIFEVEIDTLSHEHMLGVPEFGASYSSPNCCTVACAS